MLDCSAADVEHITHGPRHSPNPNWDLVYGATDFDPPSKQGERHGCLKCLGSTGIGTW